MGEIIFCYMAEPQQVKENNFQYLHPYEDINLQRVTYQRCAVTSDTSLFNRPVAVTKAAAGLSDLRALFNVENTTKLTECNHINDYHRDIDSEVNNNIIMHHDKYSDKNKEYAMQESLYANINDNVSAHQNYYANVQDTSFANKEWNMDIFSAVYLKTALHMNILPNNTSGTKEWHLNELPFVTPLYYPKHMYILPDCMLSDDIKILNIPQCIEVVHDYTKFNIFYQSAMRQSAKILQFFKENVLYKERNLFNIIYQHALSVDNNDMKIYDDITVYNDTPAMNILLDNINIEPEYKGFNIYNNYNVISYGRDFSIQSQIYGERERYFFNIYQYEDMYKDNNIMQFYNNDNFVLSNMPNTNINDITNALNPNSSTNINDITSGIEDTNILNIQDNINAIIFNDDILNVSNNIFAQSHSNDLNKFSHYFFKGHGNYGITDNLYKFILNDNKYKTIDIPILLATLTNVAEHTLCDTGYYLTYRHKPTYTFDIETFTINGTSYCLCLENVLCEDYTSSGAYLSGIDMLYKYHFRSNTNNELYQLSSQFRKVLYNNIASAHNLNSPEYGFIGEVVYAKRNPNVYTHVGNQHQVKNISRNISKPQIEITVDTIYKDFRLMRDDIVISCISKSFMMQDSLIDIQKNNNGMHTTSMYSLWRNLSQLWITEQQLRFDTYKTFVIHEPVYYMTKETLDMEILLEPWIVTKETHDTKLFWEQLRIDTKEQHLRIYRQMHNMIKDFKTIYIQADITSLTRKVLSTMYTHKVNMPSWEQMYGMIVPVSKIANNPLYIDRIDHMVKKAYTGSMTLHSDIFASVISGKELSIFNEILVDSQPYVDMMLDMAEELLVKSKLHISIYDIYWANKDGHNMTIFQDEWTYKDNKVMHIFKDEWLYKAGKQLSVFNIWQVAKAPKDLSIFQNIFATQDTKTLTLFKDEWASKDKGLYIFDDLFAKKFSELSWYDYGVWGYKDRDLSLFQQEEIIKREKDITLNLAVDAQKKAKDCFSYITILADKAMKEVPLVQAIAWADKVRKQCNIHKDDFGSWAWVYETPDPFYGDPYGIDELLLPENDTCYEDFEDIIFDKEHMRPKNPIKQMDATTFIAKYPIRHPSPKFSDIAVDYEKSAIKMQNYFGIETSIMKEIFLKYYRIWQSKIFEFSTMTMTQAVNRMLEYMYVWIMDFFPLEQIEEALRVLKLIRWYGESSVIQNSQYIITFEYDTLESKLTSGECHVPSNLGTNDTMIVDASLGVIKVNPIYVGSNKDIYVEFYINNKNNTTFTFSLSNTVGSVNIYINGTLRDTKSSSILNVTYQLPFTGSTNIIRIEKKALHNRNSTFFIGNIKVPKCAFSNLAIEFDPQLRAGNKPLDDIAKKIVAYANMHDDMKEAYEVAMKANLGISETYKKMLEYWQIHHENKTKGKRLTIKEL